MAITAETRKDIIELVVTAYNAAPGTTLLNELVAIVDGGGTLADVAANLTASTEWTSRYPSFQTAGEFADEWLGNLVPEASATALAEAKTVATGLVNGGTSFASILIEAQTFLSALAETDASFGTSAANFNNKVEVATYHTVTNETAGLSTTAFTGVTSDDATVTTATAALDAPAAVASQTYTLTTALEDKTLGGGNDSAFAVDSTTAASDTFNVSDAVDGGAGTDTFYLTIDTIGAGQTYAPSRLTNFENFSITNIGGNSMTTNVSLMAPTGIEVSASTSAVNITNVTAGSALTVTGNTAAVDIQHKNAGLTGTSDSVSIAMTGNTGGLTVDSDGVQDIESATITATGINSGSLVIGDQAASTITSLTLGGAGSLTIGGGDLATLTSLDASTNSGGVTYTTQVTAEAVSLTGGSGNDTLTGNTGDDVIQGGAGNDTLSLGGAGGDDHIDGGAGDDAVTVAGVTKDDTITGGEGTDTLTINTALSYSATTGVNQAAGISGFETLDVETTLSQDMTPLSGITGLSVGAGDTATMTKVPALTSVTLKAGASASADLTLATDGTADDLSVVLGSDVSKTASTSTSLDAVEYETMTVSSVGADSNAVTVTADALTGLTVTGSKNVTVTLSPDTGTTTLPLKTIDASAATGTVNVSAASADSGVTVTPGGDALTVTLGDGADTVTGTSKTAGDNITTGLGNDTVTGAGGNDTVSAGGGDDTVTLLGGDNNVTLGAGADTLTAGDGDNTVTNTSGNTTITLGGGTNSVTNTAGNMTLVTGAGVDTVVNTAGTASITTGAGADVITNTAGDSTIVSGDGADTITLTAGSSTVTAGAGNDTIALGSGNDTVDGGDGTDTATFSHGTGIYASTISNVETVTGTMTASGTIDLDNITGVSTLNVTANATVAALTIKDIVSGTTINVGDDLAEDSSAGDIQGLTVDTAAEAAMTLKILGNLEAALPVAADFTATTFTDVDTLTITADGGANVDQVITHDLESIALDTADTTSLTINTVANGGINIGDITGSAVLDSLTVTTAAEGDFNMEGMVEADALSSISMTATGDASVVFDDIGSTTGAILDTMTLTAQSGGDLDVFASNVESTVDMTSIIITADGSGSTITMEGDIQTEGAITTLTFSATEGATIEGDDAETFDFTTVNAWTLETDGTGSSFTMEGIASGETDIETLTIDSQGAAANIDIGDAEYEADIDTLAISVGSYAKLTATGTQTTFEDEVGMESFSFVLADNGIVDTESGGSEANDGIYVKSASFASLKIDIGASTTIEEDMLSIQSTGEEGAVTDFDLDIEAGTSAVIVDLNATDASADNAADLADTISIGGVPVVLTADDEADGEADLDGVLGWAEGNITLTGSGAHTVDLGEASGAFTVNTGSGGDTITLADGNDTISAGAGGDTINITATGSATVTGGTGADDFSFASEATTFGITTITDFLDGTDDLSINAIGTDIDNAENSITAARAQAALGDNDITFITIDAEGVSLDNSGSELIADFEDMTDVAAYLNEGFTAAASDEAGIVLFDGSNSYFYLFLDGGDTGIESDEIQLVAKITGYLIDGDNVT